MGLHETLIVETEAAFTILGLLLVFLPMFLTVLARAESSDTSMYGSRVLVIALAWSVPVLIVVAGLDATFGLFAIWGHEEAAKPTAFSASCSSTWLVAFCAVVAVEDPRHLIAASLPCEASGGRREPSFQSSAGSWAASSSAFSHSPPWAGSCSWSSGSESRPRVHRLARTSRACSWSVGRGGRGR